MVVALAPAAGAEIELERNRATHGRNRRLDCRLGKQCAPEIGMEHRSSQVEDRPKIRDRLRLETGKSRSRDIFRMGGRPSLVASGGKSIADRRDRR